MLVKARIKLIIKHTHMHDIFWEVFTREEHDAISKLMEMGERENIAQGVIEMTPDKERELQKIANHMRPIPAEFESEAMKNYLKERQEKGLDPSPQTPQEEAELQAILDAELRQYQAEHKAKGETLVRPTKEVFVKPIEKVENLEVRTVAEVVPAVPEVQTVEKKRGRPAKVK